MSKKEKVLMNEDITAEQVRCNIDGGESLGVISIETALEKANKLELDLVMIAKDAKPPVVKIMNYGKFRYDAEKRKKEQRKNQIKIDTKEIQFSVNIAENDINFKVKNSINFLQKGKHLKLKVNIRGRQMSNPELAKDVLMKVWGKLEEFADIEKEAKFEGRNYTMYLLPKS